MNALVTTLARTVTFVHVRVYRASKGRVAGRIKDMPVLLLTTPGRKSGRPHTTPLVYLLHEESVVVTGSAGGSKTEPLWFRNLREVDHTTIEVGPTRREVSVRVAEPAERDELWRQLVARAPFFESYQKRCERIIPMAVLTPF